MSLFIGHAPVPVVAPLSVAVALMRDVRRLELERAALLRQANDRLKAELERLTDPALKDALVAEYVSAGYGDAEGQPS